VPDESTWLGMDYALCTLSLSLSKNIICKNFGVTLYSTDLVVAYIQYVGFTEILAGAWC